MNNFSSEVMNEHLQPLTDNTPDGYKAFWSTVAPLPFTIMNVCLFDYCKIAVEERRPYCAIVRD